MTKSILALSLVLAVAAPAAAAPVVPPVAIPVQGEADVPTLTAPVASVTLFQDERFSFTEGERYRTFTVPDVARDRIILTLTGRPSPGEPWDRLLGLSIAGVEVLRATTPRTTFTLRRDLTRYASLLPRGAEVDAGILSGSWIGGEWLEYTASLAFYADEPTAAAVDSQKDAIAAAARWSHLSCAGDVRTATATFGATAPSSAELEITISGHGQDGEFWYLNGPKRARIFHVFVDGTEVGQAVAMPYVYALLGFSGGMNDSAHLLMWWSAFQALDAAGIHGGVGEVPSYRATIDAEHLGLLTGSRTVSIVQENGVARTGFGTCPSDANWVVSTSFATNA